jgi:hypothetical protein
MYGKRILPSALICMLFILGCETNEDNKNNGDGREQDTSNPNDSDPVNEVCDVGDPTAVCVNGPQSSINLANINNYYFTSSLDISSTVVKGGSPLVDLTFDWSEVTTDFMGHPLNPLIDVEMALITLWEAGQPEMKQMLDNDALDMNEFVAAVMAYPEDQFTSENLVDFTMYRNPIVAEADVRLRDSYFNANDPNYDPAQYTHMFLVQRNADRPGRDISMIQFFTLDSTSTNTTVKLTNNSSTLSHEVDLKSLSRIPVASGNAAIYINWEYLSTNAMGREFIVNDVNRVVVAHYSMSVCHLEDAFLDVETIHDQWYEGFLENVGFDYDLTNLRAVNGAPFAGITNDGLWIIALFCNEEKCSNPAPLFLSILQPC